MVISDNLASHFEEKRPKTIVNIENASVYLDKFGFPSDIKAKVIAIIAGEDKRDVMHPRVTEAIEGLSNEVNRGATPEQIEGIIENLAA